MLATDSGRALVDALGPSPDAGAIERARQTHDSEAVRLAGELARVRARAGGKWPAPIASALLADRDGYEMASGWLVARHKGERFLLAGYARVLDLCCGIGGDTLGLLSRGLDVLAVDLDPTRAGLCAHNAGLLPEPRGRLVARVGDALDASLPADLPFHLDPARRSGAGRTLRYGDLLPGPDAIALLVDRHPAGAVKLNPGIDSSLLPAGELEIVSEQGRLTQAVLWTGRLASARASRTATLLGSEGHAASISGAPDRSDDTSPLDELVYTVDPSVERADLIPALMEATGLRHVRPGLGLLTGPGSRPIPGEVSPFLTAYRVLDECSWSPRRARAALRSLRERGVHVGEVVVKTRARAVDPDREQARLRGEGDRTVTVFVLRFGDLGTRAVLTERLEVPRAS
ncbi:MAG: hypothetical protein ACF8Q5_08060 [Phycisphaerales bacterium JB040]